MVVDHDGEESELVECLRREDLPPGFERWRIELSPGEEHPTTGEDGSVMLVEGGLVELACHAGETRAFPAGALLAPGWLPQCRLRNPGPDPATLLAIRRRPMSSRQHIGQEDVR